VGLIRNLLAIVGILAVGMMAWMGPTLYKYKTAFDGFDDRAFDNYKKMADQLVETGNAAAATVWKAKVAEGLTFEEVDQSIKQTAIDRNIRGVGSLPLGDQVAAMTGKPWRKLNIYLYCNPLTAASGLCGLSSLPNFTGGRRKQAIVDLYARHGHDDLWR